MICELPRWHSSVRKRRRKRIGRWWCTSPRAATRYDYYRDNTSTSQKNRHTRVCISSEPVQCSVTTTRLLDTRHTLITECGYVGNAPERATITETASRRCPSVLYVEGRTSRSARHAEPFTLYDINRTRSNSSIKRTKTTRGAAEPPKRRPPTRFWGSGGHETIRMEASGHSGHGPDGTFQLDENVSDCTRGRLVGDSQHTVGSQGASPKFSSAIVHLSPVH